MRKIIAIGESVLDTLFSGGRPVRSFVGGRVACAAASLARAGVPCFMVSECTTDRVGDIIIDYLTDSGVDVHSVDRYPDGATRLSAIFTDGNKQIVNYGAYPAERFNVVWPRIDEDDIVLIGSLYAVDLPQRERLLDLLHHAQERKAIIAYLPGLQHGIGFRITHVMPNVLENMELSQLVVATSDDMARLFPGENGEQCFRNHINFDNNTFVHIDSATLAITVYNGRRVIEGAPVAAAMPGSQQMLGWQSGLTAGLLHGLLRTGVGLEQLPAVADSQWRDLLAEALRWADDCVAHDDNRISDTFSTSGIAAV